MVAFRPAVALAALVVALASESRAQAVIEGVLWDSTRTLAPLAGADVVLLSDGRTATTDRRGRFRFENVQPGEHRVGYGALWLDSIAAPPAVASASVGARGTSRVVLATASRSASQLSACGTLLPDDAGLLLGEVRDAASFTAASDVIVAARWQERLIGRNQNEVREMATVDTTSADGRYVLCGVPVGIEVTVLARHADGRATERMRLLVDAAITARDLRIGDEARLVRVSGRVVGSNGAPMPNASVFASLAQDRPATTDSAGNFALALPARSGQIFVRALGYQPALVPIDPLDETLDLGDISIAPVGAVLDTVRVTARPRTLDELGFEERRRAGLGGFVGEEVLSRLPRINATSVAQEMPPWVRSSGGRFPVFLIRRGIQFCSPRFFVDGYDWGKSTEGIDVDGILGRAKRVEAYKAGFAPPRFNDFDGCGSVVVWTR